MFVLSRVIRVYLRLSNRNAVWLCLSKITSKQYHYCWAPMGLRKRSHVYARTLSQANRTEQDHGIKPGIRVSSVPQVWSSHVTWLQLFISISAESVGRSRVVVFRSCLPILLTNGLFLKDD